MPVKVLIPTPLRKFTNNAETVSVEAENVGALLKALDTAYPGLGKPLLDDTGAPRKFVNLYKNGEDIRFLQGVETTLVDGDEVSIVPAIAGGVSASGTEVYRLAFYRQMYNTPLLYNIGKKFRVVVNIRRAMLNEDSGWAEVALSGSIEEIGRAVADLQTTGVSVTGPISDLVEPDYSLPIAATVGRGT
jgi:molybdopterin converting factor small subunit